MGNGGGGLVFRHASDLEGLIGAGNEKKRKKKRQLNSTNKGMVFSGEIGQGQGEIGRGVKSTFTFMMFLGLDYVLLVRRCRTQFV